VQLQVGSDHLDFVRIRNLLAELVDIVTEAVQNDVYKKSTDHCLTARQAMERFTLPAPLLAKVFAIPSPIPLVEPVTKATLLIKAILLLYQRICGLDMQRQVILESLYRKGRCSRDIKSQGIRSRKQWLIITWIIPLKVSGPDGSTAPIFQRSKPTQWELLGEMAGPGPTTTLPPLGETGRVFHLKHNRRSAPFV
jgi:hypothetical protein